MLIIPETGRERHNLPICRQFGAWSDGASTYDYAAGKIGGFRKNAVFAFSGRKNGDDNNPTGKMPRGTHEQDAHTT